MSPAGSCSTNPPFPLFPKQRQAGAPRRKEIQHNLLLAGRRGWWGRAAACPHVDAKLLGDGLADRSHHVGGIVVDHLLTLLLNVLALQEGNPSISILIIYNFLMN